MEEPAAGGDSSDPLEPAWGVVANVVAERLHGPDGERRRGTKNFTPGTKVHLVRYRAGMGETVTVIGLARRSRRWITLDLQVKMLDNWRAQLIHHPAVLRRLDGWHPVADADHARRLAGTLEVVARSARVRLLALDGDAFLTAADRCETSGRPVLRALTDGRAGDRRDLWYVLHEGVDPVAGAHLSERWGRTDWRGVWVAADEPDLLARLITAVERQHGHTDLTAMDSLIVRLQHGRRPPTDG